MTELNLEQIKKLHKKKYRLEFNTVLIEGEHLISELEKTSFENCEVLCTEDKNLKTKFKKRILTQSQFNKISDVDTPQGIAALIPMDNFKNVSTEKVIFLTEIQDPGNLGTIIRTLAWFGGFQLWLSTGSVDPFNSKVLRSTMGAIFHVTIKQNVEFKNVIEARKKIAYLDLKGDKISNDSFKSFDYYVFGNEARGIDIEAMEKINGKPYTICGNGQLESLNLASAVNMAIYELNR